MLRTQTVLLLVVYWPGLAQAADSVPLKAVNQGTVAITGFANGIITFSNIKDVGHGTLMGKHTSTGGFTVDPQTGTLSPVQVEVKAADGSSYFAVYGEDRDPDPVRFDFIATITGGTKRLKGARGQYRVVGEGDITITEAVIAFLASGGTMVIPIDYRLTVDGYITSPGFRHSN